MPSTASQWSAQSVNLKSKFLSTSEEMPMKSLMSLLREALGFYARSVVRSQLLLLLATTCFMSYKLEASSRGRFAESGADAIKYSDMRTKSVTVILQFSSKSPEEHTSTGQSSSFSPDIRSESGSAGDLSEGFPGTFDGEEEKFLSSPGARISSKARNRSIAGPEDPPPLDPTPGGPTNSMDFLRELPTRIFHAFCHSTTFCERTSGILSASIQSAGANQ